MSAGLHRRSFHDPDGSVFEAGERLFRAMAAPAGRRLEEFLATPLATALQQRGAMPRSASLPQAPTPDAPQRGDEGEDLLWFEHERQPFASYPHEWLPEQLADAGLFTLDLAGELRAQAWDLKDGNARNVLFDGLRPCFVDFGSLERRQDGNPLWRPAGQFQRHFMLPLLVYTMRGLAPSQVLLSRPDGLRHEEAHRCLGAAAYGNRHAFWLCAVPSLLGRLAPPAGERRWNSPPELNQRLADRAIESLRRRLSALRRSLPVPRSGWSAYETARTHYAGTELDRKRAAVAEWLSASAPDWVLDIGTNGGEFARMAAARGARVVSIDNDVDALRVARRSAQAEQAAVLHLHVDLTAPTPALGWNGAECQTFDSRCAKRFDLVMALAVMHHVVAAGRIPLRQFLAKLASYSRRHVLIEYVDPRDPMFAALIRTHGVGFESLDQAGFERALAEHFQIEARVDVVPSLRTLFLCALK